MSSILDNVLPSDLSLPPEFTHFRRIQSEMSDFCLYGPGGIGPKRFMACGAPPGSGKSLSSHAIGMLSGKKYVILTATKALQDQEVEDGFTDELTVVDVRGKSNYDCVELRPLQPDMKFTCDEGDEAECPWLGQPGCTHFDKIESAKRARGVLSNYQCWINTRARSKAGWESKGEPVGLLILDEAHRAMTELANYLKAWVSFEDCYRYVKRELKELATAAKGEEWGRVTNAWVDMLELLVLGVASEQYKISEEWDYNGAEAYRRSREYRRLDRLRRDLEKVTEHGRDNNWIWHETKNGIRFNCVWPGKYAERYLWSGVENVVLMSGTLKPKALHLLNIRATDYTFREWPRQFPKELTPIYWIPTGRMGRKAGQEELDKSIEVGERIFREWGHMKGLVHTASYPRAEWIQSMSSWGRHMFLNKRGEATEMAERFRKAKAPAALVSPSYTIGVDLPDEECEWIWVPKLPFADMSDPVMIARCQDDEDYYVYETAQTFVQECLRGSRHHKDRCTVMVTDNAVKGLMARGRRHIPNWFSVEEIKDVPRAFR